MFCSFDTPTTNSMFNSRRFWRKFDIRVTMQMHGRGQYCLMNITCWCLRWGILETVSGVSHWPTATSTSTAVSGPTKSSKWRNGSVQLSMTNQARFRYHWANSNLHNFYYKMLLSMGKTSCRFQKCQASTTPKNPRLGSKTWNSLVA